MHILIVDRSAPIPVVKYGGTERVIWGLGKSLHKLGHKITFLVPELLDSQYGEGIPLHQEKDINAQIPRDVDVVHLNYRPDYPVEKPYLITMHGNPAPEDPIDINTVFVSKNQAQRFNSNTYVHNGLSWEDYGEPQLDSPRAYYHFLGKASWRVKNVFGAARIASAAGGKLIVMGGKKWTSRNLFRGFPHVINPKIVFKGMVDNEKKMQLMEGSKGLIFPVEWHEPFGLAIIESLYAGCAVFGTTNGALPELIHPEVGVTSNDFKTLAEALKTFPYNPTACHQYAKEHFNSDRMAKEYVALYTKLLAGERLNEKIPSFRADRNSISILS